MSRISTLLASIFFTVLALNVTGQNQSSKLEVGFNLNQYHRDFGVGLHLISPYFFHSKVAVRAGASLQWFEHFDGTETVWTPYQNFQLGVRGRNTIIEDKLFIYSEGGFLAILPNSDFSSEDLEFGGYGLFGFEFKPSLNFSYYIELGGVGTGATADEVAGDPIYSNGFMTNVGFRMGF